ncbi:uncharacterized protein J7T54_000012 [Emericellopsis cladophorae]|uniref:Uncharacterized protein n=1 Tax=Emericellopsis cladophorae TaxID=2686198 RepID=A0A9P9XV62_9HYPO|nr:uncharacterized protein J7T54_000012 [Emericellopsis cladophorae]KAI6778203.1 hypothetical protein J7T54_000012 [Emericellopsis cladophorae]
MLLYSPALARTTSMPFLGDYQPKHGLAQLISRVQGEENDSAVMTSRQFEKALSRSDGWSSYYGDRDKTLHKGSSKGTAET